MSNKRVLPIKTSPLPSNMKEKWGDAYNQLKAAVTNLYGDTAKSYVRRFATAAVRDRCTEQQFSAACDLVREHGLGGIFVISRADAESAANFRKWVTEAGNEGL